MILRAFSLVLLVLLVVLAVGAPAHAQYRWVDKNGKVQFTDAPPPAGAKDVRKSSAPASDGAAPQVSFDLAKAQKDFPVVLYTSPNCKEGCDAVRNALNKRGVPFKEVQVYDQESNDELKKLSGAQEVPTLLVGRSVQRGFEQEALDGLLDSAGYPKTGVLKPLAQKAPASPEGYTPPPDAAKPATQPSPQPTGPYDTSGLTGPAPKPGPYDPSGLQGPAPKPGPYGVPAESK
jgi:glutaredoxin